MLFFVMVISHIRFQQMYELKCSVTELQTLSLSCYDWDVALCAGP